MHERDIIMLAEQADDLLALIHPHQAVIDIDTGQLAANRFVDQYRGDGTINPA